MDGNLKDGNNGVLAGLHHSCGSTPNLGCEGPSGGFKSEKHFLNFNYLPGTVKEINGRNSALLEIAQFRNKSLNISINKGGMKFTLPAEASIGFSKDRFIPIPGIFINVHPMVYSILKNYKDEK